MSDYLGIYKKNNEVGQVESRLNRVVGKGIKYPIRYSGANSDIALSVGADVINESLYMLLNTKVGERFFLPEYGTKLHNYLFQPNIYVTMDLVADEITRCINLWERRIVNVVVDVSQTPSDSSVEDDGSHLYCTINYSIKGTSDTGSYVHPINTEIYRGGSMNEQMER